MAYRDRADILRLYQTLKELLEDTHDIDTLLDRVSKLMDIDRTVLEDKIGWPPQVELQELWTYKTGGFINGLAFSDNGNLGVASEDHCYYVLDPNGKLLNRVCGNYGMEDASYCCDRFGFVNYNYNIYIAYENGTLWKEIYVGDDYDDGIIPLSDGFIACQVRCAYFDFNGNRKWDVDVGRVNNGPAVYNGYVYIPDYQWDKLIILKLNDGTKAGEIDYDEEVWDVAVCGNQLAVVTAHHLYLYDLSDPTNPKKLWEAEGFTGGYQVAFSPDCKSLAVADSVEEKLLIFDSSGNKVFEKEYNTNVPAVAWWENRIAVGLGNGEVHVYSISSIPAVDDILIKLAKYLSSI